LVKGVSGANKVGRSQQPCAEAYMNVIEVSKMQIYATSSTILMWCETRGLHRVFCDLHLSRSRRPRALITAAMDDFFQSGDCTHVQVCFG